MIYKNKTYKGMKEVFDKALDIAKNNPQEANDFFMSYVESILHENPECNTIKQAITIAKSNLGYFSGYFSDDVIELIHKTYNTNHPLFDLV